MKPVFSCIARAHLRSANSLHTVTHRYTPLHTATQRCTALHSVAHRYTPLHTVTHRCTPFHTVMHCLHGARRLGHAVLLDAPIQQTAARRGGAHGSEHGAGNREAAAPTYKQSAGACRVTTSRYDRYTQVPCTRSSSRTLRRYKRYTARRYERHTKRRYDRYTPVPVVVLHRARRWYAERPRCVDACRQPVGTAVGDCKPRDLAAELSAE